MTKVNMEYLQANGRYRRTSAKTESEWPNFLINHTDHQAHSLVDSPVFPVDRHPVVLAEWQELLVATPPPPAHYPDKLLAVCEDQNIWPVCSEIAPDIQDRQMQFKDFAEDARQNAIASATRLASGNVLINMWSIASLSIFCIVSAMILLIVLQSNVAQGLIPGGKPAASLIFMMGMIIPWRRRKAVEAFPEGQATPTTTSTLSAKQLRARRRSLKELETVRIWDEVSGLIWSASLPLAVLRANLPLTCRYTQELGAARLLGAGFFGSLVLLPGLAVSVVMGWPLLWGTIGAVLIALVGAFYGLVQGYGMYMLPPIWIVRRMYERVPVDPDDEGQGYRYNYEALPIVVPEIHTKLTSMPVEMAVAERRGAAEEVIRMASEGQSRNGGGVASLSQRNIAVAYSPRVWRAGMLYEMLKGRDIKARVKGPGTKSDKLQKISMAGMALGSIGLLIASLVFLG